MRRFTLAALVATTVLLATEAQAGDVFDGRRLYVVHCASCHGENGIPVLPGTPNLARGEGLLAPDSMLLRSLRYGKGSMPGFETVLGRKEQLDVLAYMRSLRR